MPLKMFQQIIPCPGHCVWDKDKANEPWIVSLPRRDETKESLQKQSDEVNASEQTLEVKTGEGDQGGQWNIIFYGAVSSITLCHSYRNIPEV